MGIEDIRDALVIRERSLFVLTDRAGDIPIRNTQGYGIYHADTRHVSCCNVTLNGQRPVVLLSTSELGYASEQVLTNPTFSDDGERTVPRGTIELRRARTVSDVVEERVRLRNFNPFEVRLVLAYEFAADFADIFDVRGYQRERTGKHHPPVADASTINYAYTGVDGGERRTTIHFDRVPNYVDGSTAVFQLILPPREPLELTFEIRLNGREPRRRAGGKPRVEIIREEYDRWHEASTEITTDNEFFNRVMRRALDDVRMLWSETDDGDAYPAAGTPWFDALFGRDACILSMQMLPYRSDIARHCLQVLAKWQGKNIAPPRDEEPGKILHEMRFDELSNSGELPYSPYYGSVDSTPLFLMLVAEYFAWTNDTRLLKLLLPNIRAALDWMDLFSNLGADGFVSYEKRSRKGLVNQGWKDSWDALPHADGSLASPPISLVEVQGYAYAARNRLGRILARVGEKDLAERLQRDARRMQRRFNSEFWMPEPGYYAVALDGERKPVASMTTNPAHCLWAGVVDPTRSLATVETLMSAPMFSGWGLRTLANTHPRYNPLGYHIGTIWPHDNGIAAMGMKMYGFEDEALRVVSALFDAAISFEYFRLPELFGGSTRSDYGPPVPYPVACQPQSWAAGTFPLLTQAMLGLKAEAPENRLRIVNPKLPQWLSHVQVRRLRVGRGTVTLNFRREARSTHVEVQEATGGLDIVISNKWPL